MNEITIFIYLDNEEQTPVASFYHLTSNPFKIGDKINLDVAELSPRDYHDWKEEFRIKMDEDTDKLRELFRLKTVRLTKENKYVKIKVANEDKLTIEYFCEFVTKPD